MPILYFDWLPLFQIFNLLQNDFKWFLDYMRHPCSSRGYETARGKIEGTIFFSRLQLWPFAVPWAARMPHISFKSPYQYYMVGYLVKSVKVFIRSFISTPICKLPFLNGSYCNGVFKALWVVLVMVNWICDLLFD